MPRITRYEAEQRIAWMALEIRKVFEEYKPEGGEVFVWATKDRVCVFSESSNGTHDLSINSDGVHLDSFDTDRVLTFDLDNTFKRVGHDRDR